jgi:HAD superfamily hydrolase (TIGR01484 family)
MRYFALAVDYDGTLATHGVVDSDTLAALEQVRHSGRRLLLVTGRELEDLEKVFPHLELFDLVVAENGALLYRAESRSEKVLAQRPPELFVQELRRRGVTELSVGRVIVATWEPYERIAVEVIRDLGLEVQIIFNKGAVMLLPSGVNKATGLMAALAELQLSPHNVVGVGDAENDHAFLRLCECSVAVANALPIVKQHVDFVTERTHGAGVTQVIRQLVEDDLAEVRLPRRQIVLGHDTDGQIVNMAPYGPTLLLAGSSGGGKSTFATSVLERLCEQNYQFCIIDPEGDYQELPMAVVLGTSKQAPVFEEMLKLLQDPRQNAVINLLGVPLQDRPAFFNRLLPELIQLRNAKGHPHWIIVDEAHHLFPESWSPPTPKLLRELGTFMFITVHPDGMAKPILQMVDTAVTTGKTPGEDLRDFAKSVGDPAPPLPDGEFASGEAILWRRKGDDPLRFRTIPPASERRRHVRKYAVGTIAEEHHFFFQGPQKKLNLRAHNLMMFLQIADGVDDETWLHHLRRGDYSAWFREGIKDPDMAEEAAAIENDKRLSAKESRKAIREKVENRYTAPA